jgi:hypothetical protein
MTIAAAFTDGDSDNLMVGRNGVFYDRQGRDWDATDHQARREPDLHPAGVLGAVQEVSSGSSRSRSPSGPLRAKRPPTRSSGQRRRARRHAEKKAPEAKKIDVGTVAALGVAFGAIGTLLTAMVGYLVGILTLPLLAGGVGAGRHPGADLDAVDGHRLAQAAAAQSRSPSWMRTGGR